MVQQHATNKVSTNHIDEMNEFQLVHALITQSLKGTEKENVVPSTSDENHNNLNQRRQPSAHNMIISSICQTFNAFQTSDRKQFFPTSVKEILSRFRQLHQATVNSNSANIKKPSTKTTHQPRNNHAKDKVMSPALNTCVIRHATVQLSVPLEDTLKQQGTQVTAPSRLASNVHEKVLHFENCATTPPNDQVIQPEPSPLSPPSSHVVAEVCPGGTYYTLSPKSTSKTNAKTSTEYKSPERVEKKMSPQINTPKPAPQKSSTSRNLKRVPSKRFQRMRSKVQRLMGSCHGVSDSEEESEMKHPVELNEASFLSSIRIPVSHSQDEVRQPCSIVQLADHDLCRIFSYLDTRTLASVKCSCTDFRFLIETFDIRGSDSKWTVDERYLDDPCKQCRRHFVSGDMSMCRYHPKRYYSDPPYGRSYWMCCQKQSQGEPGCRTGLHDNNWHAV